MKFAWLRVTVVLAVPLLGGCPIYPSASDYRVCTANGCFDCPDNQYSDMCITWSCYTDNDCGSGYTCQGGQCLPPGASAGSDAGPTDCGTGSACPSGTICKLSGGVASCVPAPADDASSASEWASDAAGQSTYDGFAGSDAGGDVTASTGMESGVSDTAHGDVVGPCNADTQCAPSGTCIDGLCEPASSLCSDTSQCVVVGEACVNGLCTPRCSASAPCPAGFGCNFNLGVCDLNPSPCTGSGSGACQGGAVCVETHCVPPCSTGEAGAACPSGQVCVNGGCIADQKAQFACKNDGQAGALANACGPDGVCLHHDCYTSCLVDAGGCGASVCKQVTVTAGTYAVCGTASTLGSQCDLAAGNPCSGGATCIDGYCM